MKPQYTTQISKALMNQLQTSYDTLKKDPSFQERAKKNPEALITDICMTALRGGDMMKGLSLMQGWHPQYRRSMVEFERLIGKRKVETLETPQTHLAVVKQSPEESKQTKWYQLIEKQFTSKLLCESAKKLVDFELQGYVIPGVNFIAALEAGSASSLNRMIQDFDLINDDAISLLGCIQDLKQDAPQKLMATLDRLLTIQPNRINEPLQRIINQLSLQRLIHIKDNWLCPFSYSASKTNDV